MRLGKSTIHEYLSSKYSFLDLPDDCQAHPSVKRWRPLRHPDLYRILYEYQQNMEEGKVVLTMDMLISVAADIW